MTRRQRNTAPSGSLSTWTARAAVAMAAAGCGADESWPAAPTSAGVPADAAAGCAAGSLESADGCVPAGITTCASGFEADGTGGCNPILPLEACAFGTMAVPGESACREVAPCGAGTWGDIPVDETTQHVDASYGGGDSDGTAQHPWTTVQAGIDAAEVGAIVAVAEGTYVENVLIPPHHPVRLWGRCPALVEIVGSAGAIGAVLVDIADGSEVRDLAASGGSNGIAASGATGVLIDRVWVHDAERGLAFQPTFGATEVTIRRSLVESSSLAFYAAGVTATIEASELRDTDSGVVVNDTPDGEPADVTVRSSLIAANRTWGARVLGASLVVEGTVIRDTTPRASDGLLGRGIDVTGDPGSGTRALATIRDTLIERSHDLGLFVAGGDVVVERTVVRDTSPNPAASVTGRGMDVGVHEGSGERSSALIRASVVERSFDAGIAIFFSGETTIESVIVRDTAPSAVGHLFGDGIATDQTPLAVVGSRVERSARAGLAAFGAHASVSTTAFECNAIDINGEDEPSAAFGFEDLGGNGCGCGGESFPCEARTTGLEPPLGSAPD